MSIFREIPPTAGLPVYADDIRFLFKTGNCCPSKADNKTLVSINHPDSLENDFKQYLNADYAKVTYSGTAALYLILESLKELSDKKTVIIPSFLCPLVPLAINRAGLNIEICDINKDDFNFDVPELEGICSKNKDILAIVLAHLGGIPLDFDSISRVSKAHGIFIIEDCAQSLGAEYKQKKAGALGDFSFFSLCRGKGLTIYEGGVIIANNKESAAIIDRKEEQLLKRDFISEGLKIMELFGYWVFYRPCLFWFVFRLPQIFWNLRGNRFRANIEYFEDDFPMHKVSSFRKSIGHMSFYRIEEQIDKQRQKADYYIQGIQDIPGIRIIKEPKEARASYPYLTLIFDDPDKRLRALRIFENSGLGVSQIYTAALTGYEYLRRIIPDKNCPRADYLACRQMTLSTSAFLKNKELDLIVSILKKL
ncbi:MAG: DegT/DnrJ/EryC1/StrS family aminotransferase [Candidatus Omnitrophota bacterium]